MSNIYWYVPLNFAALSRTDMHRYLSCTKPGGHAELAGLEIHVYSDDSTPTEENAFKKIITVINDAYVKMGRPQSTGSGMKQHLEQASFVDVKVTGVEKPYSP